MATSKNIQQLKDGSIISPKGFTATGIHTKVKKKRNDLGLVLCEVPADAAAVYTLNQVTAAPISVTKESIHAEGKIQAVIVNSGNANACTGKQGLLDAYTMRDQVAQKFQLNEMHVAVASTGVIGDAMPMDKIVPGIHQLQPSNDGTSGAAFNEAILTTDTVEKTICLQAEIDGKVVTIAGSAKGSGMIAPNMATMLGFITTDIKIDHMVLQKALSHVTDETFNRITVDGDTSTNDMVLVMASGLADNESITEEHPDYDVFMTLLFKVCEALAKKIARDGEGATKLIEVNIDGAVNDEDAGKVAKSIVGSSLVKTMVYGADPNWGRLMMAIGKSGADINQHTIDIHLGEQSLLQQSEPTNYLEEELSNYLKNEIVQIYIHLHKGDGKGKAWGCDLTYDYVRINASYRT